MLQRAASNAYSWWWASHIRTKQSKWLEQNLQDMEEKVESMLKLISEDGDSFAKRAEMYYKRRPELINFVEESYRAYRSLAERYDHISTELQNANNTIATYLPDQVKFDMDDEDDDDVSPRSRRRKKMPPQFPRPSPSDNNVGIPNVPKAPLKNLKTIISTSACAKKFRPKKESEAAAAYKKACAAASSSTQNSKSSGLTKPQALQKIDKLQKDILGLQTVKEFVKSSYEGGLAKYWEIDDQITGMQAEVSSLQDEFNETVVIEDDEARSLMTSTAIKSCQEKLASLQQKHHKSVESAKIERLRVKELRDKFNALMNKEQQVVISTKTKLAEDEEEEEEEEEEAAAYALEEKIKQHYIDQVESSTSSSSSLTVDEVTEKVDELVNKVINLETAVSSQDALIVRLKNEADDLQSKIQVVEKLDDESTKLKEMKKMEEKLEGVEKLSVDVKKQNVNVHTHITEAKCNVQHLCQVHSIIKSDDVNLNMEQQQQEEMTKVLPNKKREEEMPTVLPKNKREEEMTMTLPNKKKDEEMTKVLPNKKREADEVVDNETKNIVSEKVKKNKELDGSENAGGSLLPKKSDEEVVDQIVDKDNKWEDEEKMKNNDLDDSNNKQEMEQKSTSSSSSSRKQRSESSGGGGLLSGAKKLMGFKVVVREEANSSAVSTSTDSDGNQNKDNVIINDKKKQQEQEENEKEKHEPNHVVEERRITGSQTDSSTSTLSVEKEEEENKKKTTNAPTEVVVAAATAQSNYDAQSKKTTPHLQHQEELICDVKNNEVIQLEKTNLVAAAAATEQSNYDARSKKTTPHLQHQEELIGDVKNNEVIQLEKTNLVAAAATEQSNYDAQSKNTTPHLQHQEELIDDVKKSVPDELTHLEKPPQHQQNLKQQDDNGKQQVTSSFSKGNEKTSEYAATLRNYKDMKKKVSEENKISELEQLDVVLVAPTTNTEDNSSSCIADLDEQLRALKTANALKDEEIRSLRQKLEHLQTVLGQPKVIIVKENLRVPSSSSRKATEEEENDDYDMKGLMMSMNMGGGEEQVVSEVEEKLRMEIDQVLEVNLDFWLRFSEALNQIQKYESVVEDLRREISKLEEKANKQKQQKEQQEGSSHRSSISSRTMNDLKSDLKPIYKHLSEIQTELAVWMDKCVMLKEEQQSRFSSLCDIQEEITQAVKVSAEDEDFRFTSYQAAKFQGEILNMKQENNKVANELQAGLDHITVLQLDVDRTLGRLNDDYEFSGPAQQQPSSLTHSPSRNRVPLRSFIFGVKQKKKPSIFTCMTPAMHRKYNGLRVGF